MTERDRLLQARQPPVRQPDDVPVVLVALLEQRAEALVEPRRRVRKVCLDVRVHDLVHERAAAGRDVHEQPVMRARVEPVRRVGRLAGQLEHAGVVAVLAVEQVDVEDPGRPRSKEVGLEQIRRPPHRRRVVGERARARVADDHERRLDPDRGVTEPVLAQRRAQLRHVARVRVGDRGLGRRRRARNRRNDRAAQAYKDDLPPLRLPRNVSTSPKNPFGSSNITKWCVCGSTWMSMRGMFATRSR